MSKESCSYCGLPFRVLGTPAAPPAPAVPPKTADSSALRAASDAPASSTAPAYCCSGCALAARLPLDEKGQFPVNAALVTALSVGFAYFNQLLFCLLAVLLAREGRVATAEQFVLGSLGVGAGVWLVLFITQLKSVGRDGMEVFVSLSALGVLIAGFVTGSPYCAAASNGVLLVWAGRGLFRKSRAPGRDGD